MFKEIDKYLNIFRLSYIFNLGHGLLPETNPDVLVKVIKRVNLLNEKSSYYYLTWVVQQLKFCEPFYLIYLMIQR